MHTITGSENFKPSSTMLVSAFQSVGGDKSHYDQQHDSILITKAASEAPDEAFVQLFEYTESALKAMLAEDVYNFSGTTAVLAHVGPGGTIKTAHIGDSRAILFQRDRETGRITHIPLTKDHTPARQDEADRVSANKKYYTDGGVIRTGGKGWISISRAFGDAVWADVIISKPEINRYDAADVFKPDHDTYLYLDSDGARKNITADEQTMLLKSYLRMKDKPLSPAEFLGQATLSKGGSDNISILFAKLDPNQADGAVLGVFDGHGRDGYQVSQRAASFIREKLLP